MVWLHEVYTGLVHEGLADAGRAQYSALGQAARTRRY